MPAYNAARTLAATWQAIPHDEVDEVLLVDDGSRDDTLKVAAELPIRTIALPHNVGYGGNQKACYLEAIRLGADVVVMLHPDGQYDPVLSPDLVAPIVRRRGRLRARQPHDDPWRRGPGACRSTATCRTRH